MKKGLLFVVCTMLVLSSILSGCGSNQGAGTETHTLTVSVYDRGTIPASEGNYEENRWTKYISEKSGINVKWVPIPRNESRQKINMLIASGEAPDLIVDYDVSLISSMVEQGAIQPIDEFVEKYSTIYKKYLEENPQLRNFVTYNGKMYAATSKRSQDAILNHGVWIRQDWLDKLGLKTPTTDIELLNVAKEFRDRDPDGNGVKDTTAFSIMNWHEIFPAMYQANFLWYNEDGVLKHGHTLDRYGDALEYLKTLYDEELIDKEFITDKDSTRQKQLWVTGKTGILTASWNETLNKDLLVNNPNAKPVPLKPVSSKYGLNGFWQEAEPLFYVAFNKNMKNPEDAMKLLDWMLDGNWFNIKFGLENVHYKLVNGVPQTIDVTKMSQEVSYANDYAILSQWNLKPESIPIMAAQDTMSQTLAKEREESLKVNGSVKFRRDIPVDPQIDEVVKVLNDFGPQRDDIRMKVIIGGPRYTKEWGMEQIRKEWKRLGGENAERLMNEWYKQNQ